MARRRNAGQAADATPEVGPDEEGAVQLFFGLASQWRTHPMSGARIGIDYPAIRPTAELLGIPVTPALFHDLQVMEGAALAAFPRS